MDNDAVGVPIDMACHSAITFQSNSHDLNNQNNIMAEFPALSMMHDELLNNLHEGLHLPNHAGIATSSARIPGSTSQLERIDIGDNNSLIGRSYPISNIEDYFFDTVRSSLGNSANYGYDGMLGDINSKWDFNKFPAPQLPGPIPQTTGHEPFQIMGSVDQNGWISESTGLSSESTSGSSRYSNKLSLTLCGTTIPEQCLEMTGSVQTCSKSKSLSLGFGYEPVHFSQSFSGSRFLNEMQEILSEIARYSLGNSGLFSYPVRTGIGVTFSGPPARRSYTAMGPDDLPDGNDPMLIRREVEAKKKHLGNDPMLIRREGESKKKHLVELLQLVDNRYNKCLDEIHKVISAFHAVTELDPHTHTRFALQAISLLHKNLRERISNNILAMGAHFSEGDRGEEEISFETSFIQKQWALQQLKRNEHQLWRPQRGLPERSVSVLRAWMFQNFLHPYPKDAEKHLLAVKSGLTRSQVSNWFINARVRLWKPLIDEMYSEIRRRKARRSDEETGTQHRNLLSMDNLQRFRIN